MSAVVDAGFLINAAWVQSVLDDVLYNARPRIHTLPSQLRLVQAFLENPDLPAVCRDPHYALVSILLSFITNGLKHHRLLNHLPTPDPEERVTEAYRALERDAQHGSRELICWSCLYYRYVRYDLDLSLAVLYQMLSINERTFRRYQSHAVKRLTQRLLQAEQDQFVRERQQWLLCQLPSRSPVHLFGREVERTAIKDRLSSGQPSHMLISGEEGIGKTVLAQECLREKIVLNQLRHIIWIDQPSDVDAVRHRLLSDLLPSGTLQDVQDYLTRYATAIVLDNAALLLSGSISELLHDLNAADVLITSRKPARLENVFHLPLRELSPDPALEFAYFTAKRHFAFSDEDLRELASEAQNHGMGNPGYIKQYICCSSEEIESSQP